MSQQNKDFDLVQDMSADAYTDAIDILELIEAVEAGNSPEVMVGLNRRDVGRTALLVRNSLLFRVHVCVSRAYAPTRKGDRHLRRAFELLQSPEVRQEIDRVGGLEDLELAEKLWATAQSDARLPPILHMRHKMLAHLAEPDPQMPLPRYNDLFGVARATASVMEKLAHATRVITIDIQHQMDAPKVSIRNFWGIWK